MLKLPKFTFLCGPRGLGQLELAKALSAQDDELQWLDIEEPVRNATQELFFGGFDPNRDMTSDVSRTGIEIGDEGGRMTLDQWYDAFEGFLHTVHMPLGRIALSNWQDDGADTIFDRFLYRDCRRSSDVVPFVEEFPNEVLLIHLDIPDSTRWRVTGNNAINLYMGYPELDQRLLQLKRELGEK